MTARPIQLALILLGVANVGQAADPNAGRPVDAAAVAKQPAPGTASPGSFGFAPDGRSLTYLKSESASLSRVLWRVAVDGSEPAVVARPPGQGDTDGNVSPEEALRRERQRLRETGIAQVVRAEKVDAAVIPLGGDLYLQKGNGPLERITETPAPELDPKLSDDGSKVAFVREGELDAIDLSTRAETKLTEGALDGLTHGLAEFAAQEELDRSQGFWWSPDGEKLAYEEVDERAVPLYSIVHQGGDDLSIETHRYPFAGAANAKVRLGVVDAKGGPTRWLALDGPGADFYLARVHWDSPTTLLVQTLARDQKSLRLARVDANDGSSRTLLEEVSPSWINLHDDLRVIEATGEFVWSSERTGFRHLELRDRDGKLIRTLTAGAWPVDGVVGFDARRGEVWFASGFESPLEAQLARVSLDGGPIVRVSGDPGMHRSVVADDGEHFVDVHSSRTKPPLATLHRRNGTVVKTLNDGSADPRVKELRLIAPALLSFASRDGQTLHGAFYPARSAALGPQAPLVVMLYGGPHVQLVANSWALTSDLMAQFLAERGFAVWKMDNRGSARRGLAFEAAIDRRMGEVEVRDQVDGVAFVASTHPEVDTGRVGVTGASYGGYMTLRCLSEAPEVFKAGVAVAPVTDWSGYDTAYTERYLGTPIENAAGYKGSSVLERAGAIRGELLLIHGMLDENVHFRHTARLATALISAGKSFALLPLPGERHSSRKEPDRAYVVGRVISFFEAALKPK